MVFALEEIIKLKDTDNEIYQYFITQIESFESQNKDVALFLKEKAINYEKRKKSRTFLYINEKGELQGYFSLAVKVLQFSDKAIISGSLKKKISGGKTKDNSAIVYLIGQLGRDKNRSNHGFGSELLKIAFGYLYKAQSIVGIRYCLVETEDTEENKKVINFYNKSGFSYLQKDKNDNFQQLVVELNT